MLLLLAAGVGMGASPAQAPFVTGVYYVWSEAPRSLVFSEVARSMTWAEPA